MHSVSSSLVIAALLALACDGGDDGATTAMSGSSTSSTSGSTGEDNGAEATQWCLCMVANCHDGYHARWGEDHEASLQMCEAEGREQSLAELECRLTACELAAEDLARCDAAFGGAPCGE